MRVLGISVAGLRARFAKTIAELIAIDRLLRSLPGQLDRGLAIGDEIVEIGRRMLEIAERLDQRGYTITELGERLDLRAIQLLQMGENMHELGIQIDATGAQIVDRANHVAASAGELITILPTVERALDLASPLEGAIDRFGRIVDRFPGAASARRREQARPSPDDRQGATPEAPATADVTDLTAADVTDVTDTDF